MQLFDSHAHLTVDHDPNLEQIQFVLERAEQAGVSAIANICVDEASLKRGLDAARRFNSPKLYNVAASTPHDVQHDGEKFFPLVEQAAKQGLLVAIGETGLDYHYFHSPKESQQVYFRKYLQLANEVGLPVVVHCRDAFKDFFQILDEENQHFRNPIKGVLHCFTGTLDEAKEVLDRGWFISLSGIVTFKNSHSLREVVSYVPLDKLLIETDTPYLAPLAYRGKKNEPAFIVETASLIASIRKMLPEQIAQHTYENAKQFFNLAI